MGKFSKDKRDIYYRKAKELGYRARSAFKLLQIARRFDIFSGVSRVVDLCAAPGGWTEVISDHMFGPQGAPCDTDSGEAEAAAGEAASSAAACSTASIAAASASTASSLPSSAPAAAASCSSAPSFPSSASASAPTPRVIVAVDLQAMAPLPGVHFIKGDLTRASTALEICAALGFEPAPSSDGSGAPQQQQQQALAELVVCDGAPDVIGMQDIDEAIQYELLLSAFNVSLQLLRAGGCFVAKIFRGRSAANMYALFRTYFDRVTISKPSTCRNSSIEGFVVCQQFRGLDASQRLQLRSRPVRMEDATVAPGAVEFVCCGDEEGLDSDRSYPLSYQFTCTEGRQPLHAANRPAAASASDPASSPSAPAAAYQSRAPQQLPIDPPYKRSLQMKKDNKF